MVTCECPICDVRLNLEGCNEDDLVECPKCGTRLEIVSLTPLVLEEVSGEDWEEEG